MKKTAIFCITLLMIVSLSVTAFAAPGIFVSSPSGNLAPVLVDFEALTDGCEANLVITPYSERDTLGAEDRGAIEEAYKHISDKEENKSFDEAMKKIAEEKGLKVGDLSVSDLFHVGYENCEVHELDGHKGFKITLKSKTAENLAGLLHYDGENWSNVKILEYNEEDGTVTFLADELGCFAFVVDKYIPPHTGDTSMVYLWAVIAAVGAVALVLTATPKKQKS